MAMGTECTGRDVSSNQRVFQEKPFFSQVLGLRFLLSASAKISQQTVFRALLGTVGCFEVQLEVLNLDYQVW